MIRRILGSCSDVIVSMRTAMRPRDGACAVGDMYLSGARPIICMGSRLISMAHAHFHLRLKNPAQIWEEVLCEFSACLSALRRRSVKEIRYGGINMRQCL